MVESVEVDFTADLRSHSRRMGRADTQTTTVLQIDVAMCIWSDLFEHDPVSFITAREHQLRAIGRRGRGALWAEAEPAVMFPLDPSRAHIDPAEEKLASRVVLAQHEARSSGWRNTSFGWSKR